MLPATRSGNHRKRFHLRFDVNAPNPSPRKELTGSRFAIVGHQSHDRRR